MLKIKQVFLEGKYVLLRPPSINDLDALTSTARMERYGITHILYFQLEVKYQNIYKIYCQKVINNNKRKLFCLL